MRCRFALTEDDYVRAMKQMAARRMLASRIFLLAGIGVLALLAQPWAGERSLAYFGVTSAVLLAVMAGSPVLLAAKWRKLFRQASGGKAVETELRLEEDHLVLEDHTGVTRKPFGEIHRVRETRDYFFHYLHDHVAQIIPKDPVPEDMSAVLRRFVA